MTSYNKKINIITYHYVRNLNSKLFPDLKVLELNKFEKQIKYLKKKFEILSFEEINFLLKKNLKFPTYGELVDNYQNYTLKME